MDVVVSDHAAAARFELRVDGELVGHADYRLSGNRVVFTHLEVDPAREGQGLGSKLAGAALDSVLARGLQITPLCPFVAAYVQRNPRYLAQVDPAHRAGPAGRDTIRDMNELVIAARRLPTVELAQFYADDARRASSFVTNFGTWSLPAEASAALGGFPRGHLEWFHDTGELVLFGAIPRFGVSESELSPGEARGEEAESLLGQGLVPTRRIGTTVAGLVRVLFEAEVLPAGTRAAVLAVLGHGPAVHEQLWGWHRAHRRDDGWAWLAERLASWPPA